MFGDGYTAGEMQKFRDQVDKHLNIQWSFEPFKSYRNYFNVYMIEVESPVSGISCDPDDGNVRRATPLRLQYAGTCPAEPNARGITFGSGGTTVLNQLAAQIPGVVAANRQTLTSGQHEHVRRHRRHRRDDLGRFAAGSADQARTSSVTRSAASQDEYPYSARNVTGRRVRRRRAPARSTTRLYTVEQMLTGPAEVVALARRGVLVGRPDRALRERQHALPPASGGPASTR